MTSYYHSSVNVFPTCVANGTELGKLERLAEHGQHLPEVCKPMCHLDPEEERAGDGNILRRSGQWAAES